LAESKFECESNVALVEPEKPAYVHEASAIELSGPEFAKLWNLTPRALRYYESQRLIAPRRQGRVRIYSQVDSHRVGLILKGKKLGFTLNEISDMIDTAGGGTSPKGLRLTERACLKQIECLQSQMKTISEALAELERIHLSLSDKAGVKAPLTPK
jgi:DNA-binding transcriptional MerR regulator